jgi:hypothetical protein
VGPAPGAAFFCRALTDPGADDLIVHRGTTCFVILNLFPYNNGHLMVIPNRHIATLASATREERTELIELTTRAEIALTEALPAAGPEPGYQPGQTGRRRDPRSRAHARGAALEWRHELHDRRRGDPCPCPRNCRIRPRKLRPIFERLTA